MNFRLTAILFGVVLLLVVGLLINALFFSGDTSATDGPFAALATGAKPEDTITAIELARTEPRDEKLVFEKKDGKWRLTAPASAPADTDALNKLVGDLLALKPTEHAPVERSAVGLGRPAVTVTLRAGDKAVSAHVGDTTTGGEQAVTFFAPANEPNARPMAVPTRGIRNSLFRPGTTVVADHAAILMKWRSDFRAKQLLTVDLKDPETDGTTLALSRADKKLALTRAGGEWRFTEPAEYGLADASGSPEPDSARFTGVRPLLNAVQFLGITSSADVKEDVPPADLPQYGLADADNPLKVQFSAKDKPTQTLFIGKRMEKDGKPQMPTRHYVRVEGDSAVFQVTTDAFDRLANTLADPSALRNRDLLPPTKFAKIDAVDSTVGGRFKLRRVGAGADAKWELYGGPKDPTEASTPAVQAVLTRLSAPRVAADVLPKPDDAAFDAQNLQGELTVWFEGPDKKPVSLKDGAPPPDPPAPTGEPLTLRVGRQFTKKVPRADGITEDRPMAVVRRTQGKESADFEVSQEVAALAVQPRLKLVNARLPSFAPPSVTRLVLFRDKVRTEYVKSAATDPAYPRGLWTVGENGPTADGDGVMDVLNRLAILQPPLAVEWADDLKALGLDPADPTLSAKVTVPADKGGTRDEEFHFGNPVKGDDKSVYAKAVGKPFVYAVPVAEVARLRTADLTDKVAFRVPRDKLVRLELSGWRQLSADKKETAVKAEPKGGAWVLTEPAGAAADAARLEEWANALLYPKVIGPAPVEKDKAPPPEYGFGEPIGVTATYKGDKPEDKDRAVFLTLGGLNADHTGVYAMVNGECKLLAVGPFERLLTKPPLAVK